MPRQFGPELKKAFVPIIKNQLIPEYIEKNREAAWKARSPRTSPGRAVEGLVDLYKKAGHRRLRLETLRPGPRQDHVALHTFDPPEKKLWEDGHRFREVTVPEGAENWFTPEFDPKAAGWKTGHAPFANNDGKLGPPSATASASTTSAAAAIRPTPSGTRRCC